MTRVTRILAGLLAVATLALPAAAVAGATDTTSSRMSPMLGEGGCC